MEKTKTCLLTGRKAKKGESGQGDEVNCSEKLSSKFGAYLSLYYASFQDPVHPRSALICGHVTVQTLLKVLVLKHIQITLISVVTPQTFPIADLFPNVSHSFVY